MRILYVSYDNPAVDTILAGMNDDELWGLPALYYPFRIFRERGVDVDILLFSEDKDKSIVESTYFKKENLILRTLSGNALVRMATVYFDTKNILKSAKYDFVYGMGEGTQPALWIATKLGIPTGLRQFGTQEMANVLEQIPYGLKRWVKSIKDYTYITLSMFSKKTFILATNDGSRADELYDILGIKKKKFKFFFWRSGVNIPEEQPLVELINSNLYPEAYGQLHLSHIGRICDVKRQDRSAKILGELHKRGYPFHLHFVGYPTDKTMLEATLQVAKEYVVEDYIHVEGNQRQSVCRQYARNSFATLLPGEWNRVNIFYEVMGEGSVVVTNNNHSIDEFIEDGENCIVYDTEEEAADKIIALLNDPEAIQKIRANAHKTAIDKFMTVEKRFGMEAQLVMDAAEGKDISGYPEII